MHQQVRTSIRPRNSERQRAAIDEDSLLGILTLLRGTQLRSAGRVRLDDGSEEFVFSVDHVDGDDKPDNDACEILTGKGYEAEVFPAEYELLDHRPGALLRHIRTLEKSKEWLVTEVHVLAGEQDGKVPVQFVTRPVVNRTP